MQVVTSIADARAAIAAARQRSMTIGFVPTMGYLHEGHLALVRAARADADFVVLSIFVNPLQFGPTEDFSRYPRDNAGDEAKARQCGTELLFRPTVAEMYRPEAQVRVTPADIASRWEGEIRPGHFAGVLTVVAKLFNIVAPDLAVFGQKDFQQAALVRALVRDLDFPIRLIVHPTVREADHVAMSSRNAYLTDGDRVNARLLSRALRAVQMRFREGERNVATLVASGRATLAAAPLVGIDYLAIIDPDDLAPLENAKVGSVVIVAARVGRTRLLDNSILGAAEAWLDDAE